MDKKILVILIIISVILIGIGVYLRTLDHTVHRTVFNLPQCSSSRCNPYGHPDEIITNTSELVYVKVIPPPWYASLWPVFLVSGIGLIGFSLIIQIVRRKK